MGKTKEELLQDGLEVQPNNLLHLAGVVPLPPPVEAMLLEEPLAFLTPRKVLDRPLVSLTLRMAPEELLVFLRSESEVLLLLPHSHRQDFPWRLPAGS